jgi:hypothetical protein
MKRVASIALAALLLAGCQEKSSSTASPPASAVASASAPPPAADSAPSAATTANAAPSAAPAGEASDSPAAKVPDEVVVQHILIGYRGAKRVRRNTTRTKAEAKALAEEVLAKAKAGEDFTELVRKYSEDPEAISRMGSLGKIRHGDMTKPFEDAAFALKMGQISDVVETKFGFHIIKRNQ